MNCTVQYMCKLLHVKELRDCDLCFIMTGLKCTLSLKLQKYGLERLKNVHVQVQYSISFVLLPSSQDIPVLRYKMLKSIDSIENCRRRIIYNVTLVLHK